MAKFSPSIRKAIKNFSLRTDVEDLKNAYEASLRGLVHREDDIEREARMLIGIGADDEWPKSSDDDDLISLVYEQAGELSAQARRGARMVRQAFLIALFHTWERHCNAFLGRNYYDQSVVAKKILVRDGHSELVAPLRELQLAANCAKHSSGCSCSELAALRPDYFIADPRSNKSASERTMRIEEHDLLVFFDAVLKATK